MRPRCKCFGWRPPYYWALIGLTTLAPRAAEAIVVLQRGSDQPLMGYLVRESEQSLVIRQELPGGQTREVTVPKNDVEELMITVAPDRLAALDPSRPGQYREYAEELAEKRRDPEARDTARRLFAIAAHRGDESLRHSALLSLVALARSSDEERRLRALAYLHDPRRDESVLQTPERIANTQNDEGTAELLSALRLIRQGKATAAKQLLDQPLVKRRLSRSDSPITAGEMMSLASTTSLTPEQLAKLLRAELAFEAATSEGHALRGLSRWSLSDAASLAPMPLLKLENLTEFDPLECRYQAGRWLKP